MTRGRDPWASAAHDRMPVQLDLFAPAMPVRLGDHPLYGVWSQMKARCFNPKERNFKHYGGRGIVVCEEWLASSRPFIAWALSNGWQPGLQIDRRDNDGPYSPGNCQFVTCSANASNRRNTVRLSDGRAAWPLARLAGVNHGAFAKRIRRGWSAEQAAGIAPPPVRPRSGAVSGLTGPQRAPHGPTYQKPPNAAPAASPALCDGINKRKGRAK